MAHIRAKYLKLIFEEISADGVVGGEMCLRHNDHATQRSCLTPELKGN